MICFTVFNLEISPEIGVVNDGIGIQGRLAKLADNKYFPKPQLSHLVGNPAYSTIPSNLPETVIYRAGFFQYRNSSGERYSPIIFAEDYQHPSNDALVLWIVKQDYLTICPSFKTIKAINLLGCSYLQGYDSFLFRMKNTGAHINVKKRISNTTINLSYFHGVLKIIEKPIKTTTRH